MIILLLIQYFDQRPLSKKNMNFNINYIVSVPPFCICYYLCEVKKRVSMKKNSTDLIINSMDPDQAWHFVGPNPGSKHLSFMNNYIS